MATSRARLRGHRTAIAVGPGDRDPNRRRRRHPQALAKRRDDDRSSDRERGTASHGAPKRRAGAAGWTRKPGQGGASIRSFRGLSGPRGQRRRPFGLECGARDVAHPRSPRFRSRSAPRAGARATRERGDRARRRALAERRGHAHRLLGDADRRDRCSPLGLIGGLVVAVRRFRSTGSEEEPRQPHRRARLHRQGRRRARGPQPRDLRLRRRRLERRQAGHRRGWRRGDRDRRRRAAVALALRVSRAGGGQLLRGHLDHLQLRRARRPGRHARDTSTSTRPTSSTRGPSPPSARRSGRCRARSRRSSFIADEEGVYPRPLDRLLRRRRVPGHARDREGGLGRGVRGLHRGPQRRPPSRSGGRSRRRAAAEADATTRLRRDCRAGGGGSADAAPDRSQTAAPRS